MKWTFGNKPPEEPAEQKEVIGQQPWRFQHDYREAIENEMKIFLKREAEKLVHEISNGRRGIEIELMRHVEPRSEISLHASQRRFRLVKSRPAIFLFNCISKTRNSAKNLKKHRSQNHE